MNKKKKELLKKIYLSVVKGNMRICEINDNINKLSIPRCHRGELMWTFVLIRNSQYQIEIAKGWQNSINDYLDGMLGVRVDIYNFLTEDEFKDMVSQGIGVERDRIKFINDEHL